MLQASDRYLSEYVGKIRKVIANWYFTDIYAKSIDLMVAKSIGTPKQPKGVWIIKHQQQKYNTIKWKF